MEEEAISAFNSSNLPLVPEGRLTGFIDGLKEYKLSAICALTYKLLYSYYNSMKVPNSALIPCSHFWPSIVLKLSI